MAAATTPPTAKARTGLRVAAALGVPPAASQSALDKHCVTLAPLAVCLHMVQASFSPHFASSCPIKPHWFVLQDAIVRHEETTPVHHLHPSVSLQPPSSSP